MELTEEEKALVARHRETVAEYGQRVMPESPLQRLIQYFGLTRELVAAKVSNSNNKALGVSSERLRQMVGEKDAPTQARLMQAVKSAAKEAGFTEEKVVAVASMISPTLLGCEPSPIDQYAAQLCGREDPSLHGKAE